MFKKICLKEVEHLLNKHYGRGQKNITSSNKNSYIKLSVISVISTLLNYHKFICQIKNILMQVRIHYKFPKIVGFIFSQFRTTPT